jgi:histidine triad (HIT) family protein
MPIELPSDDPCSFCEYLAGRRPYTILDRDEVTATLVTRQQRGRLHVLVIPVRHRPTVLDVEPEEYGGMMAGVVRASRAIAAAVDANGIAVWQNNGVAARQTVPHVHFHVVATLPDGGTAWGPVPTLSVEETDNLAAVLRPHWLAAVHS